MLKRSFAVIGAVLMLSISALGAEPQATSPEGKKYLALAKQYQPKNESQKAIVLKYMKMDKGQRQQVSKGTMKGFDVSMPWDYLSYSVCFFSQLTGGGVSDENIIEAGKDCHEQYLD